MGAFDTDLLYAGRDSAAVKGDAESSWTADTALVLATDAGVSPGAYASTLTPSLIEDAVPPAQP